MCTDKWCPYYGMPFNSSEEGFPSGVLIRKTSVYQYVLGVTFISLTSPIMSISSMTMFHVILVKISP